MYNLLSALLIVAAVTAGFREGFEPNQLYHLGMLVLLGYLFGLAAERIRIPAVLGYIAAGIIAGPGCTGLIDNQFLDNMSFIGALLTMILLAESAARMCRAPASSAVRFALTGAAASMAMFGIAMLLLMPVPMPVNGRIGLGLFAAALSPLIMDAIHGNQANERHHLISFGGLAITVAAWGIAIALLGPPNPERLRITFMPAFIALTSAVCGYAMGLAAHALAGNIPLIRNRLYLAAVLFIAYPLIGKLGLDYLFLAIGFGIITGIASRGDTSAPPTSPLVSIVVFTFFGLSLALDSMVGMSAVEWRLAALVAAAIIGGRSLVFMAVSMVTKKTGGLPLSPVPLLPVGPVALILVLRFFPGISSSSSDSTGQFALFRICTASIVIILIFTVIQIWTSRGIASRSIWRMPTDREL